MPKTWARIYLFENGSSHGFWGCLQRCLTWRDELNTLSASFPYSMCFVDVCFRSNACCALFFFQETLNNACMLDWVLTYVRPVIHTLTYYCDFATVTDIVSEVQSGSTCWICILSDTLLKIFLAAFYLASVLTYFPAYIWHSFWIRLAYIQA